MKKLFFSFVMLVALVIVAGSAGAQTAITPYAGTTYTYTLGGVKLNTEGTATVSIVNGTSWSLVSAADQNGALSVAGTVVTVPTSSNELIFTIKYNDNETTGPKTLNVLIADGGGCTNYINLGITVVAKPTLELAVTSSTSEICQTTDNTSDNTAGSVGATNTFTFTVTPTFSSATVADGAKYAFNFDLNDYVLDATGANTVISIARTSGDGIATPSGSGSAQIAITGATNTQTFTVTFATTTGAAPETITGTASGAVLTVGGSGTGTYNGTYNPDHVDVVVKTTPSIGQFTWN